ncbi:TonB-dependent receptor [Pseudomonas nitroreducens]|uniref:TonB-dependent siderophore receptor n=1 Tax=Pseudomonas nitroreducens TaxID=46680 RepID=A0A6G6IRZ3_PSENT|nr:TonB-dependent siderophore receptor [Pseudomonas nitroreducens]QIE85762.1 TonB-dependent siderophore receptor [Pseudomonas nitroreducens]
MSRQSTEFAGSKPRLLVSAVGVAITAMSGTHLAHADEAVPKKSGQDVLSLDADTVVGAQQQDPTTYNVEKSSNEKYTAPLLETPKTVTVIPQQVIKDTGALTLQDALRSTPGITFGAGEGGNPAGDRPFIRGFNAESDTFLDGMRDVASQTREIFNIEQIEVSKGPGSAYTGAGSTGGSLNLISKTAKQADFNDASIVLGTDQTRRTTLDVNHRLGDNAAFRLNLMKHDANVAGRDEVNVSRWGVAPTVTFGFDTPTRATLSYYHLSTDDMPDYGIPLTLAGRSERNPSKPVSVDKSNFYGLNDRDYRKSTTDTGTFRIEHDLNDNLTLSNSFRLVRTTLDYIVTNPDDSRGNVANGLVYRSSKNRNSTSKGWVNQTDLKATFDTGFVGHTLVTGMEFSYEDVHNRPYVITPGGGSGNTCTPGLLASGDCTSLNKPTPGDHWTGSITDSAAFTDTDTKTASAYVFDTLKLSEQWDLNLGLRYDDYETRSSGYSTGGRGSPAGDFDRQSNTHFWNYQLGVVYKPAPNGSIYAAWSTSSNPSGETAGEGGGDLSLANANLDPERNRNYEIGTKWAFFDEALSLNAAIFRTDKTNARVASPDDSTVQVLDGEQRVQGVELGFSGALTPKWKVFGGYTYLDSEILKSSVASDEGNRMPQTAQNNFTLWSTYDVLQNFTVGGGATYVDEQYGNTANSTMIPSYWRYDAMAKYVISRNVDLQLNVQNLTDKRYFDQVFSTHMAHVAPGRTALLGVNVHF